MFLSGLTCTEDNFIHKAGALRSASRLGLAIVAPDTSPRGLNVPGEAERWQFGVGAGFYLNATVPKWKNWRMYDYVATELPALVTAHLPLVRCRSMRGKGRVGGPDMGGGADRRTGRQDADRVSLFGHSMGGMGALLVALRNPTKYKVRAHLTKARGHDSGRP